VLPNSVRRRKREQRQEVQQPAGVSSHPPFGANVPKIVNIICRRCIQALSEGTPRPSKSDSIPSAARARYIRRGLRPSGILAVFAVVAFLYCADVETESALSRLRKGSKTSESEMPYSDLRSCPRWVKTGACHLPQVLPGS
jgi:hypothetical protein